MSNQTISIFTKPHPSLSLIVQSKDPEDKVQRQQIFSLDQAEQYFFELAEPQNTHHIHIFPAGCSIIPALVSKVYPPQFSSLSSYSWLQIQISHSDESHTTRVALSVLSEELAR